MNQLAYINSFFAGLVPCKILSVADGNSKSYIDPSWHRRWARVKCTANRKGYERGKVYELPLSAIVPRTAVYRSRQRCGQFMIRPYAWEV